jgi:hypothetical protein
MTAHEYTVAERTQNQFTTKKKTKKKLTQRRKGAKVRQEEYSPQRHKGHQAWKAKVL